MRTSDMIKSKFWRAGDLQGQPPVVLTIAHVTEELMGRPGSKQDAKCFLWFQEHLKGLQLNKTRVRTLEAAYGPDSELWTGKRVRLTYDPTVEFGGRPVGGVRLQTPPNVVYTGAPDPGAWGSPAAAAPVPGRPPAPVWDEQRQMWITPAASPPQALRPPPPIWNEATQSWDLVNPDTGEIAHRGGAAPATNGHQRPQTMRERINGAHPPNGAPTDDGWGPLPPPSGAAREEFDDDIPF